MNFLDPHHPFFKPLWVRVLTVLVPLVWAGVELYSGEAGWAIISFALAFYAALQLFWVFYKKPGKDKGETP
ncbi:hypothetical protein [Rhizobium paknamense]|uniref:DUF3329 domain-containing protein n=1 Tax=Rhizobium paknamense TaxID=1206817 RepID=A0ABU0IB85_9HYPH|nr:hypothetical protein [Rhizobium paknamense]MDQ0455490.1 hypothetical protein [Rhizobium paknamense]